MISNIILERIGNGGVITIDSGSCLVNDKVVRTVGMQIHREDRLTRTIYRSDMSIVN